MAKQTVPAFLPAEIAARNYARMHVAAMTLERRMIDKR